MADNALSLLIASMASGGIEVVDLTQTLAPEFPQLTLPPEMGQCWPFRIEEVSRYDDRGPTWYWNNFSCNEHTGTHFDAPIHWVSGRHLPNNATDTIPVEHMIAPAVVLDCSRQVAEDADYLLSRAFVEAWEAEHGRIPAGASNNAIAMNIDLLPTLANWTGSPVPDVVLDGADISTLFTIPHAPSPHDELVLFNNEDVAAIRTQRWKYIVRSHYRTYDAQLDAPGRVDWAVLVDMDNDPTESYDVSSRHPDVLVDMERRVARARATFDPLKTPPKAG